MGIKNKKLQRVVRDIIYYGLRATLYTLQAIPFRLGQRIGSFVGGLVYFLLPYERKLAHKHLAQAFPHWSESQRSQTIRKMFRHFGMSFFEFTLLDQLRGRESEFFSGDLIQALKAATSEGKGVICITAHAGNWELLPAYVGMLGHPIAAVARPVYDERISQLLIKRRESYGTTMILRDSPNAGRQLIRTLKDNRALGMLIDQDVKTVQNVFVPFFGKLAATPAAPAILALKRDAPILITFTRRKPDGTHEFVAIGPFHGENTGDHEADVLKLTTHFSQEIENWIRQYPEQWVWMHRRWRQQPNES